MQQNGLGSCCTSKRERLIYSFQTPFLIVAPFFDLIRYYHPSAMEARGSFAAASALAAATPPPPLLSSASAILYV